MSHPLASTFVKLPAHYEVIEFHPAPDGWIAYFLDGTEPNPEKLLLRAVPISMWALVEYEVGRSIEMEPPYAQEIRPMVVLTNGKIVDYLDTPTPTTPLCVFGPHIQNHPERVGAMLSILGYEIKDTPGIVVDN